MTRKQKTKTKLHSRTKSESQPEYIVAWEGFAPTKPFPTDQLQKYEDPTRGKNIECHYNKSRGIYHYTIKADDISTLKKQKVQDASASVVDFGCPEKEAKSDEKLMRKETGVITRSQLSIFKLPNNELTTKQKSSQCSSAINFN